MVPSGLKAGRSLLSPARVVPALIPSSLVTVTSRSLPSSSTNLVVTGTISCWNRPEVCALAALCEQQLLYFLLHCRQTDLRNFDSLLLRTESEGVLFFSGYPESLCDVLRRDAAQINTQTRSLFRRLCRLSTRSENSTEGCCCLSNIR